MYSLHIEHGIKDFAMWKEAFDRDPAARAASGVLAYRVSRPVDDSLYVVIELDFAQAEAASAFLTKLQDTVWNTPEFAPALAGAPKTRVVETIASESYA